MVQCHISLLPMNSHWQQDYAQREPLLTDTPELCCRNARTLLAKSQQGGKSRLYFALWLSKEGQGSCFCVALNGQTRGVGRPSHAQGRTPHQSALTEHSGFCITLKSRISACSARRHWTRLTRRGSCPWAARP